GSWRSCCRRAWHPAIGASRLVSFLPTIPPVTTGTPWSTTSGARPGNSAATSLFVSPSRAPSFRPWQRCARRARSCPPLARCGAPQPPRPLALLSSATLPLALFYVGHPFRIRYMVPLVVASAVLAAIAIARLPRVARGFAAVALFGVAVYSRPPFDRTAPMVAEAQWEAPFRTG